MPPQTFLRRKASQRSSPISQKRPCIGYQPTHNRSTMEALSNPSKVETMRMLNSIVDMGTSECGSTSECGLYATAEAVDKVHSWMYTFCKKSTENDRPRAYRKALEALVEVIEKDKTNAETPTTLGIRDNDVIMVHHQSDSNKENMTDTSSHKHNVTTDKKNKVAWKTSSRGKAQIKLDKHTMTVEDYKRQHSMILSKLHEEMQPRLREIRMKLNTLDIERQPPKIEE